MKVKIKEQEVVYVTEIRTGTTFINERGEKDYQRIRRSSLPAPHPLLKPNGQVSNDIGCFDYWRTNDTFFKKTS
jgi:hypothetical protein